MLRLYTARFVPDDSNSSCYIAFDSPSYENIRLARWENMHKRVLSCIFPHIAIVAQLVEHLTRNEKVAGSIPADGSEMK